MSDELQGTNKPTVAPLPYRIEERDGLRVRVYESGLELNDATKKIIKPAPHTMITSEKTPVLLRQRQEKQAALLRRFITETYNDSMPSPVKTSTGAFAAAGAMLFEQIVLNSEAYPRDRLETWKDLGKYAQVLPSDIRKQEPDTQSAAATAVLQAGTALILERLWADVRKKQDADVIPMRNAIDVDGE